MRNNLVHVPSSSLDLLDCFLSGNRRCQHGSSYSLYYQNKPYFLDLEPNVLCLCELGSHPGPWFGGKQSWDRNKRKEWERIPNEEYGNKIGTY